MASIIRIKRSEVSGNPATLGAGELAYSGLPDNGSNGGDRLYIGIGTETEGDALNHYVIGGKFFTDRLDHTAGVLTANSAIVIDGDSKIDILNVDNLTLNGNTLSTTNTDGDLLITPNGTGKTVISNLYVDDDATSITEFIQDLTGGSLVAGEGIDLDYNDTAGTTTISAELASDTNKGVASFDNTDFIVVEGVVELNAESVQDIVGGMVSSNTESGITVTYNDDLGKFNFDVNDPLITIAGDVDGSATMTNLGNTTINVTLDTVNSNVGSFGSSTNVPVITVNGKGLITAVTTAAISTSFTIAGDTGTDTFDNGGTLTFTGSGSIDTAITNDTVTISAKDATTSVKGVASFDSGDFSVTSGAVSIKAGGIDNNQLANSSVTFGTTTVALGASSTSIAGVTQLDVDNIRINGNEISSTNGDGNISLNPNGTGNVDVNSSRIVGLSDPISATDAANKQYVDNAITGLNFKAAVNLLAVSNISLSGTTNTLVIDNHDPLVSADTGYRILLTGQSTDSENGIYVYTDNGSTYTLTRPTDADTFDELQGASVLVLEGDVYGSTGWVQENYATTDFTGQNWVQFSGAGSFTAGAGLTQDGIIFNVGAGNGITVNADDVALASSVAGAGLTFNTGVISIGGTADRITVGTDDIDIAATYVGQTSITTLGTITTGAWNATTIGTVYGGTGLTSYTTGDILYASASNTLAKLAAGVEGKVLQISASGIPTWDDVDGGTY